jgi:catechol 2,3-dioxygenase-like lactoylglutathione lyase family enzyme
MSLSSSALVAFVATTDAARARAFYETTLGLRIVEETPFALVADANGTMLRIQRVKELSPPPFTALGWKVEDIRASIAALVARGVTFERFGSLPQDDDGVWTAPGGAKIAWFKDPEGYILSLQQE